MGSSCLQDTRRCGRGGAVAGGSRSLPRARAVCQKVLEQPFPPFGFGVSYLSGGRCVRGFRMNSRVPIALWIRGSSQSRTRDIR